jgi:hypothetical protein
MQRCGWDDRERSENREAVIWILERSDTVKETYLEQKTVETALRQAGSQFFTVRFRKLNGAKRTINARLGVTKHLRGGESTVAHLSYLQTVFDNTKREYRCFDKRRCVSITAGKRKLSRW